MHVEQAFHVFLMSGAIDHVKITHTNARIDRVLRRATFAKVRSEIVNIRVIFRDQ